MSNQSSHLQKLIGLAKEPSSDKRRELLREITDVFMEKPQAYSDAENSHFGDIIGAIASQMEVDVRQALAAQMSGVDSAPHALVKQLANDEIRVAQPILTHSSVLRDEDLMDIVSKLSQDHLLAISGRDTLSEAVGNALVQSGDDAVLVRLAKNEGAQLSRQAMETMVDRAEKNEALHKPIAHRHDLPPDLLNEMYFFVSNKIRQHILETNAKIDEKELDQALSQSRTKLTKNSIFTELDGYADAKKFVDKLERYKELNERKLLELFNNGQFNEFIVGLSRLGQMDIRTVKRIMTDKACDALTIVCRALNFDRSTFSTFALQRGLRKETSGKQAHYAVQDYNQIPVETAQRTMRFWRVRQGVSKNTDSPKPSASQAPRTGAVNAA